MNPEYYYFFILLIIPVLIWARYSTSLGKRSQRALVPILSKLQNETEGPLFVAMYENEGSVLFFFDQNKFYCYNSSGIVLELNRNEITNIEHSMYGFFHIITSTNRYRFAYVHHAVDAKGLFTMTFGPSYRDDDAVMLLTSTLQKLNWPHSEVEQASLAFLPQIKV